MPHVFPRIAHPSGNMTTTSSINAAARTDTAALNHIAMPLMFFRDETEWT